MRQPNPPVLGPVLLAVVAVLSCLAYATGTVSVTRSEFTWSADQIGGPIPLVLSAQSPELLKADGPCAIAASADPVELLSTGSDGTSLTLMGQDGKAWLAYAGTQIGQVLPAEGQCSISLTYQRAENTAVLAVGERETQGQLVPLSSGLGTVPYRQFAVTSLHAAPGFEAVMTTQPTTFSSSGWRLLLLVLCLGSLLALGVLLHRNQVRPRDPIRAPRWSASDSLVAVVGLFALIVVPPRFDDGWVLTTVRQYADLGFFSNYYSIDAAAQPQGFWWTWIERLWLTPLGTPGFLIRLPTVLILLGTWWFLRRHVLSRLDLEAPAMWGAAAVACAGMIGLQITIRPEPVVALLLAAAISVVVRYAMNREPHMLVVLTGLSAAALAAHQTGWAVVAASASVLPWAMDWLRQPRAWITALAMAVTGGAVLTVLLMLGSNATLWWRSVRAFAADTTTYQSLLDEGDRIGSLASGLSSPTVTTAAVGLLILAILGFLLRSQRGDVEGLAAGWAAVAAVGGLLLTSSKLIDHYGAVVPSAVVLTGIALRRIRSTVAVGTLLAVVVIVLAGIAQAGSWALGLDRVAEYVPGFTRLMSAGLLILVVAGLLIALVRGVVKPTAAAALAVAWGVLVSATSALAPVVVEGVGQPGSWLGQQMGVFEGRTCGLIDVVVVHQATPSVFVNPQSGEGFQEIRVGEGAVAWARGPLFSPMRLEVLDGDGDVTSEALAPSSTIWSQVPLPEGAATLSWTQSGVSVVTTTSVPAQSASEMFAATKGSWWVNPGLGLQTPCVPSVSIKDGTVNAVEHSVGPPSWVAAGLDGGAAFEAGCAGTEQGLRGACLVSLSKTPEVVTYRTITESIG